MPEKKGRKRKYETPEHLKRAIQAYIDQCEAADVFPDEAGMRLFIGITRREYYSLTSDKENPEYWREFGDILDWAKDKRESYLTRKMTKETKLANGCLNALKQPMNGGYVDRPSGGDKVELNIKVDGIGGMDKFK